MADDIIKQREQITRKSPAPLKREFSEKKYDYAIYGEYSIKNGEIVIFPKLYDIKNEKNYSLQTVRIPEYKRKFNISSLDKLVNSYKEKIGSLTKSDLHLLRVGLLWSANKGTSFSAFEKKLYRSYLIETTKSADTISLVDVLSWNLLEPYYSEVQNYSEISNNLNADLLYSILFQKVSDYEMKADIELFDHKLNKVYKLPGFRFEIIKFSKVGDKLAFDFYHLLKDLKTGDSFDFGLLNNLEKEAQDIETYAINLSHENKFLLSNIMFNCTLDSFPVSNKNKYYYYAVGHNFSSLLDYERSIYYLDKSLSLDPKYEPCLFDKGLCYFNLMKYQTALESYLKVEGLNPNFGKGSLQFNIGLCYYYMNRKKESLAYFNKVFEKGFLDTNDVYYNIAMIYGDLEDYKSSIEFFSRRIDLNPKDFYAGVYLAYSYYMAGNNAYEKQKYEQASQFLDNIEKISIINQYPDSNRYYKIFRNYINVARLTHLNLNDYEKAFIITQNGINNGDFNKSLVFKNNAFILNSLKARGSESKRYEEIIKYCKLHLETNPNDSFIHEVYNLMVYNYSKLGDLNNCMKYIEKSIEANPDIVAYYLNKMEINIVRKNYNEVVNTSNLILNSPLLMSQLDTIPESKTMFNFFLVNADIAEGKDYIEHQLSTERTMNDKDLVITWDFSLYENWFNEFNGTNKAILSKMYRDLKSHSKPE
jgi:tetratricopeptide (TPR) repeat protein